MNGTDQRPNTDSRHEALRLLDLRIRRLREFASPRSVFSGPGRALDTCVGELERILPELTRWFGDEEELVRIPELRAHVDSGGWDLWLAENRSRLRELRLLAQAGRRLLEETDRLDDPSVQAEALNTYLCASLAEWIDSFARLHLAGDSVTS